MGSLGIKLPGMLRRAVSPQSGLGCWLPAGICAFMCMKESCVLPRESRRA